MSDPSKFEPTKVKFHYQKSQFFRVIHVDGVIGNLTPQGLLHLAVFSERTAIPQSAVHELHQGSLGQVVETEGKEGFVREIDTDLIMTKDAAVGIRDWLNEMLKDYERAVNTKGSE